MNQWFEAYAKWPATNQLLFSAVALGIGLVLVMLALMAVYYLIYYMAVFFRGWPVKHDPNRPTWDEVRELSKHMEAYRKWDKEQKAKVSAEAAQCKQEAITYQTPCGPRKVIKASCKEALFEDASKATGE